MLAKSTSVSTGCETGSARRETKTAGEARRTGAIVQRQLRVSNLEEQAQVVARECAVLAHNLSHAIQILGADIAKALDVVNVRSDDLSRGSA